MAWEPVIEIPLGGRPRIDGVCRCKGHDRETKDLSPPDLRQRRETQVVAAERDSLTVCLPATFLAFSTVAAAHRLGSDRRQHGTMPTKLVVAGRRLPPG